MLLTLSGRSYIKIQYSSFPLFPVAYPSRIAIHYNITSSARNDVIFPYGCEAHAINPDNKNMKIGIFIGGTSVRSKNISTAILRYPTGKHEIKSHYGHNSHYTPETAWPIPRLVCVIGCCNRATTVNEMIWLLHYGQSVDELI